MTVRLVAICRVGGIARILTFNVHHFVRAATLVPGLTATDPASIANVAR